MFGELDRGQSLEDRVERSREKPGLLTGNDDHGIFLTKSLDVGEGQVARAGPCVLISERVGHEVARERLRGDLLRAPAESRSVQAAGCVKPRDAVEIVEKIVEEPRRARNLTETDCVVCHSFPSLLIWE